MSRAAPGRAERGCHGGVTLCRRYPGDMGTHRELRLRHMPGVGGAWPVPPAPRPRRGRPGAVPGPVRGMAGLSGARSASPGSPPALDGSFLLSPLGGLMCAQAVSTGEGARRRGEGIAHCGDFFSWKQPGFSSAAAPTPSPLSNPR